MSNSLHFSAGATPRAAHYTADIMPGRHQESLPDTLRALNELSTGVLSLDDDGKVHFCNLAGEALLGISARRLRGRPLAGWLADASGFAAALEQTRAVGNARLVLLVNLAGLPAVRLGAQLRTASAAGFWLELHSLALAADVESAAGLQAGLLRAIGHEVRNPLGGIRAAAQLLEDEAEPCERAQLAELIQREVDRLSRLIDRWDETARAMHHRRSNVHEALDHVFRLMAAELRGRVSLRRDYDVSLPERALDSNRLIQALINLVRNAEQAGATHVCLRTRAASGRRLRLEVEDDGPGVPPALMHQVFEPLVTGRPEGLGLGLSIVAAVAREHGGRVHLDSRPGRTVFSLDLPWEPSHVV